MKKFIAAMTTATITLGSAFCMNQIASGMTASYNASRKAEKTIFWSALNTQVAPARIAPIATNTKSKRWRSPYDGLELPTDALYGASVDQRIITCRVALDNLLKKTKRQEQLMSEIDKMYKLRSMICNYNTRISFLNGSTFEQQKELIKVTKKVERAVGSIVDRHRELMAARKIQNGDILDNREQKALDRLQFTREKALQNAHFNQLRDTQSDASFAARKDIIGKKNWH